VKKALVKAHTKHSKKLKERIRTRWIFKKQIKKLKIFGIFFSKFSF
jgi:hypothetical protein